jgi:hypothetical protein
MRTEIVEPDAEEKYYRTIAKAFQSPTSSDRLLHRRRQRWNSQPLTIEIFLRRGEHMIQFLGFLWCSGMVIG